MSSNINSPKKSDLLKSKELYIGKYSPKEIYSKYLTVEKIKRNPEVIPALRGDKKINLTILSKQKPKFINIKSIQNINQNKIKFASRLNSFHKIFFNCNKNNKNSINEINLIKKENKDFSIKYKNSNKNNVQDNFSDIKLEYEKKNINIKGFEGKKNLFNGHILLSNKEELKNLILYDLGTRESNYKSLSFLHKINKKLGDKTSEKEIKKINLKLDLVSLSEDKIKNDKQKEIEKNINDIINVKETINSMDEIKYFFDIDNKKYLEFLKNGSRGSSAKVSTRVNSAINYFENVKNQYTISQINDETNKNQINKNNNYNSLINNMKKINYIKLQKKGRNKTKINKNNKYPTNLYINTVGSGNELSKSPLENLYDNISTEENLLNCQPEIQNYLKNRNFDLTVKIDPSSICNNFEKTRGRICNSEFLKQDMNLRKQINGNIVLAEKVKNNDIKSKIKINNIENKIIKIFCNINNPRKKEEE